MSEPNGAVHLAGATLQDRWHVCALFHSREEEYNVLMPFIQEGLARGDRAFHIVDPALRADHIHRLAGNGIDCAPAERSGQLEVRVWQEAYLRGGRFDQHAMLALVEQVLQAGHDQGYPCTRMVAHMEWALESLPGVDDLIEYEARANYVLVRYPDPVV